jgi:hypothetical protein
LQAGTVIKKYARTGTHALCCIGITGINFYTHPPFICCQNPGISNCFKSQTGYSSNQHYQPMNVVKNFRAHLNKVGFYSPQAEWLKGQKISGTKNNKYFSIY